MLDHDDNNIFDKFNIEEFKNFPPPSDNSSETKKEIEFLKWYPSSPKFFDSINAKSICFCNGIHIFYWNQYDFYEIGMVFTESTGY